MRKTSCLHLGKDQARMSRLNSQKWGSRKQNKEDTKAYVLLILCVNFTGAKRMPGYLGVSVRVFPSEISIYIRRSEDCPHQCWWASAHPRRIQTEQKRWRKGKFALCLPLDITLLVLGPLDSILYHWPLISQTLAFRLNCITQLSWFSSLQMADCRTS